MEVDAAGNLVECFIHDSDLFLVAAMAESTFVFSAYMNTLKGIIEMALGIFNNLVLAGN